MVSKPLDENKQSLSENRHFKSFQTSPVPPRTDKRQKDVTSFTSATTKKELDWQTGEISSFHEYKLHKHQHVPCLEDISNLKMHVQKLARKLEEKEKELLKEKSEILEERVLVIQQDKILEDMQIKIRHLEAQLKNRELIGLKMSKKLWNQIEPLGEGSRNFLWLFGKIVLHSGCSCITLAFFQKCGGTWVYWLLNRISQQYYGSWAWPH
ncbi:uncharacterized protein LOC110357134 isoform X2 [Columba livia]|uniref:uncharacterized protein LOC110357134 isoform X2 n=1 Tax=Columba livia TaxID=8932 RepID=UPI000A374C63|nr:uncharacterized protein LOC110357134 isoform X4 [Columba livia]